AEGSGLRKEEILEFGFVGGLAEDGEKSAGAILFHLDGRGEDVQGAGSEGTFEEIAVNLRIEVVEVGFDDADFLAVFASVRDGVFADHEAKYVGLGFKVGCACAVADGGNGHWRLRAKGVTQGGDDSRPSGRDKFFLYASGIGGLAEEQARGGWRGYRKNAMRHFRGAAADIQGGADEALNAEKGETDAGADDVHDGIHGSYFVEMDFFDGHVVNSCFGFAKLAKDGDGAIANGRGELGFLQDGFDSGERTVRMRFLSDHANVRGGHTVFPDDFRADFPAGDVEGL